MARIIVNSFLQCGWKVSILEFKFLTDIRMPYYLISILGNLHCGNTSYVVCKYNVLSFFLNPLFQCDMSSVCKLDSHGHVVFIR